MIAENGIPCPICSTKIPFDVNQLLMGVQFACPQCNALIGLGKESKPVVEKAMQKLEEAKGRSDVKSIPGIKNA